MITQVASWVTDAPDFVGANYFLRLLYSASLMEEIKLASSPAQLIAADAGDEGDEGEPVSIHGPPADDDEGDDAEQMPPRRPRNRGHCAVRLQRENHAHSFLQ